MKITMRNGIGEVNGEIVKMSFCPMKVEVGEMWQTLRGEWKIATEYYGKFDMPDGPMWGYATRLATEAEIAEWTKPVPAEDYEKFWKEFGDATDYIQA